jgi:uncharacterized protein
LEIKRVSGNIPNIPDKKAVAGKSDFSQSFDSQREKQSEDQFKETFEKIKRKGKRLSVTKNFIDVDDYKRMIKEYLQYVINHMYNVKRNMSFWQTQYYITVDTIDKKLEELTEMILDDQKENLNIASIIDEITGLLVDVYK